MDKKVLQQLIGRRLSMREIAGECGCSYSTIRYWFEKYQLQTVHRQGNKGGVSASIRHRMDQIGSPYLCKYCGETNPERFMNSGNGRKSFSRCKKCHSKLSIARFRRNKEKAVSYKGGRCEICGYDRCLGSLHFHHTDPSKKDPDFRHFKFRNFDKVKTELDRCLLLCANCHGEQHWTTELSI